MMLSESEKKTEKTRNVPQLRFARFTDDWEQRKVYEVAETTYGGGTPKTSISDYWNGKIPWIQSKDILENNVLNVVPRKYISNKAVQKSATKLIPANSIAIVTRVGVGKLAIMPYQYATSQDFLSLSNLKVDTLFAVYNLYKRLQRDSNFVQGTSIKGITKNELLNKKIMIPVEINEQSKIGCFFERLDHLIALHQRKLDLLEERKKGYLQKMFPKKDEKEPELRFSGHTDAWEQSKLGELLKWSKGKGLPKNDLNDKGRGKPALHYADLYKYSAVETNVIHWTESDTGRIIPDNSILFPVSDVTPTGLARTSTLLLSQVKAGGDVLIGTLKSDILSTFMSYQINAKSDRILPLVTGTTIKHINAVSLSTLYERIPTVREQSKIGQFLNKLDYLIILHQRKLDVLKERRKAYLQKMFV
ncbi:restriction endonuclease subunit S [Ligilactobacillus acidipiscis]|uniref:restriction endonuclease subunit S n=1 Tax=Ligilactobacillus acidipiscis TaxID=89059 RepID=UPI0023F8AEB0|nr:restriction endonuclease subunit S [Ligilactobacillus acidipiscis]WEV56244.1 restriction endonuclease subunit S [Ligilactobacillus acidipiscis]